MIVIRAILILICGLLTVGSCVVLFTNPVFKISFLLLLLIAVGFLYALTTGWPTIEKQKQWQQESDGKTRQSSTLNKIGEFCLVCICIAIPINLINSVNTGSLYIGGRRGPNFIQYSESPESFIFSFILYFVIFIRLFLIWRKFKKSSSTQCHRMYFQSEAPRSRHILQMVFSCVARKEAESIRYRYPRQPFFTKTLNLCVIQCFKRGGDINPAWEMVMILRL